MKNQKIRRNLTIVIIIIGILTSLLLLHQIANYRNKEGSQHRIHSKTPDKMLPDANHPLATSSAGLKEPIGKEEENTLSTNNKLDSLSVELEGLSGDLLKEPLGIVVAQSRTDRIISNLKKETLEDSLANLDNVDEFFYPGYFSSGALERPFDTVQTILSNRRFIKLYDELRSKSNNEQYTYLNKALKDNISQFRDLLSRYKNDQVISKEDYLDFSRISHGPGKPPTISGTRLAIQSISLLCGALGNAQMWPELREVFMNPVTGSNTSLDEYGSYVRDRLSRKHVFSTGIQAQTIWLLSQHSKEEQAAQYGFDSSNVKSLVSDNMLRTITVPNYQSRTTKYDLSHRSGRKPIDQSSGSHSIKFLISDNIDLLKKITTF
ncbi:MAG: hypothetical protein GY845_31415 [Planctomycetes bacterium]|nr:hypothetical protein [Planctomycetota bacterium]